MLKNFWKQSKGWATALKNNIFLRARLKLTIFYFLVVAIIVLGFSFILYSSLLANISDNFEGQFVDSESQETVFSNIKDNLQRDIVVIDLIVILIDTGIGYWLSGQTLKPIRKTLDSQKQFTADAAHELRTPLAVIKTSTEVAVGKQNITKEQLLELSKSNLEEVDRLSQNVESLLMLAREDNHKKNKKFSSVDINSLINRIVVRLSIIAREKDVNINFANSGSIHILGEAESLETAVLNLVKNAIQYTSEGGLVEIELKKTDGNVILKIKDNGIGISKDDLPHVFEPFYKADKSRSQFKGGIGLGLSLVKKIIDRHNAKINVKSASGQGTEILVVFKAGTSS
jgi:signal transduction histidine kinase